MIRYEVRSSYGISIVPHECDRETEKCVWVKSTWGREQWMRRARKAEGSEFFEAWESAHAEAVRLAELKLGNAKQALDRARSQLETVKALKQTAPTNGGSDD